MGNLLHEKRGAMNFNHLNGSVGILFSCSSEEPDNPLEAMEHLKNHKELYWSVSFRINRDNFFYPLNGFINMKKRIRYKCTIIDIKKYDASDHEDIAKKPERWMIKKQEGESRKYKTTMVFSKIEPFDLDYKTGKVKNLEGKSINRANQSYQRIFLPKQ